MIVKNQLLSLTCLRLGAEMEGICEYEGQTVFVANALPGEEIEAKAMRVAPRYAFAKLMTIRKPSKDRQTPVCPVYEVCGGCSGQHMTYEVTLAAKRQQVLECLRRIGGFSLADEDVPPVLGAERPLHCRNKTSLPVGGTADQPELGFYRRRSNRLVPIQECAVAMDGVPEVISAVQDWMKTAAIIPYHEENGEKNPKGLLRHVIVRQSRSGELMVLLVAAREKLPDMPWLLQLLKERVPGFCALHVSVNTSPTNVILGKTCIKLYGQNAITEQILGLDFEISPLSFFQVHPWQTERLYQTAIDFAQLSAEDTIVDAYAGAGTIALCMANSAKKVIGIEIVPQAVESAKRSAARNHIENAEFYTDAVENLLPKLVAGGLCPDVIVLDPPRKGVDPAVIEAVRKAAPRRVVYISCHVPSQARDLALLAADGAYVLDKCQPVDMFCYAGGVENVAVMVRGGE